MRLFKQKQDHKICEVVPFMFNRARTMKGSKDYKRQVRNIAGQLREFEQSRRMVLYSNSLTTEMCDDLHDFFSSKNLLENTVSGTMSKIFTHFRAMRRNGYTVNNGFEEYRLKTESVTTVFLTVDEIKRLYALKTRNNLVRDLFVVGCFTGMRYSDFSTLTDKNIVGNSIVKKTRKTGVHVEVPIHPIVREILERYDGFPPYRDTQQNFNNVIKTLCKRAGITDKVLIERTRSSKIERLSVPRYKLVASHTARRSFATNAYLAGIPTARIMLITGHKTEQSFFGYIRINKKENARELSGHPFFQ